jgi:hypothetical protein
MDLDEIKKELESFQKKSTAQYEKIDFDKYVWKPKEPGKYTIRFVPSKLNKKNPFQKIFLHYGYSKVPIISLINWGEQDPIVSYAKTLRETGKKENYALSKKLDPKIRYCAPIIVRGEEDKGVKLYDFGKIIYTQLLNIANDEDYGDFSDIEAGRDFTITVVKEKVMGKDTLKATLNPKPKTSKLGNEAQCKLWLEEQPEYLVFNRKPDYDYIERVFNTWLAEPKVEDKVEDKPESEDLMDEVQKLLGK